LRQVSATVTSNEKVLGEITHRSGRSISCVHLIWLDCLEIAQEAKPGQFVMVGCGEECVLPRPFSIHQVNEGGIALYFNVWEDGKGTQWLAQRKASDKIDLLGSLGNSYYIHPESRKLLLVAGGIGIASLRFLADEAVKQGLTVTLICGTPTGDHRYPPNRLPPKVELIPVTEDGSIGRKGLATDLLSDFAGGADQVFACGPTAMYYDMARRKGKLGLNGKPVQISLEARMGCGRGVCYACTVRTRRGLKQVCKDGPVFTLDDIIWDELSPRL
jgi:dihydroorotate dehydrogenase electron transfer subunit